MNGKEDILYSAVEESWIDCSEDKEEAISYVLSKYDASQISEMKKVTIYKGVEKKQNFNQFLNVSQILENINEAAYERCGEGVEDYLTYLPQEVEDDLEKVINDWHTRHNLEPTFFMIEDIEPVEVDL